MKEMFAWVPWFNELARRIADGGQQYLEDRASRVEWVGGSPLPGADVLNPLLFLTAVANEGGKTDSRDRVFASLAEVFEIHRLQNADSPNVWHFPHSLRLFQYDNPDDPANRDVVWRLLRTAVSGSLDDETFDAAAHLPGIGWSRLSSALVLIDAEAHLHLSEAAGGYSEAYGVSPVGQELRLADYRARIAKARNNFPGCELYEIGMFARLQVSEKEGGKNLTVRPDRCWIVSTRLGEPGERRDHWLDDFDSNNRVRTGKNYDGLSDAAVGDIVLVRCGVTEGRGIGIVLENGYGNGWAEEEAIHVLWLNKTPLNLRTVASAETNPTHQTRRTAWSRAISNEETLFRACAEYQPTFEVLDRVSYGREVEAALREDPTDLGEVWRRRRRKESMPTIRASIGNAHTVRQAHKLLLVGTVPEAATIRRQVASRVRGFATRHLGRLSVRTVEKLEALATECEGQMPVAPHDPEKMRGTVTERSNVRKRHAENRILYGPPGTGKTYHTAGHALAILDGAGTRDVTDDDKRRFRDLRFVAEDISPRIRLGPKEQPPHEPPANSPPDPSAERRYWLMSLGHESKEWPACYKSGVASLGYDEHPVGDLRQYASKQEVDRAMGVESGTRLMHPRRELWEFSHVMKAGDLIFVKRGQDHVLGHGVVQSEYRYDPRKNAHKHLREVRWVSNHILPGRRVDRRLVTKYLTDITENVDQVNDLKAVLGLSDDTLTTGHTSADQALAAVDGTEASEVIEGDKKRYQSVASSGRVAMVTFHQNYSYEDFVEGIRPRLVGSGDGGEESESTGASPSSKLDYELRPGIFRRICKAAEAERSDAANASREPERFVLIIDEINRGNIPKIFGELITLIEPSRRLGADDGTTVTLPYSGDDFGVPNNLYIIGTMNTADRSIQQMDTALRRRFTFVEMMPDAEHDLISKDVDGVNCQKMLLAMNERIVLLLDREHQIGHTYLLNVDTMEQLADTFRNQVFPLLQEYFYDDWRKIRAVLGKNAFVRERPSGDGYRADLAEDFGLDSADDKIYDRIPLDDESWIDAEQYKQIYADSGKS
jgi:hypothetical protein